MLVPDTLAASTSPSPAKVPPVIFTVALVSVRLSGSDTEIAGEMVIVCCGRKFTALATFDNVGASLMAVIATVVNCGVLVLFEALPSLTVQVSTRLRNEPSLVGLSLAAA